MKLIGFMLTFFGGFWMISILPVESKLTAIIPLLMVGIGAVLQVDRSRLHD